MFRVCTGFGLICILGGKGLGFRDGAVQVFGFRASVKGLSSRSFGARPTPSLLESNVV